MHFPTTTTAATILLLLLTSTLSLAAPLSLSFTDIEKRWSAGESDASIHALHNPRSASPSWPLIRSEPVRASHFASSYDARTQKKRRSEASIKSEASISSSALMDRIKDYASRLLRSKDEGLIAERSSSAETETEKAGMAPVLRPRKVRYAFSV